VGPGNSRNLGEGRDMDERAPPPVHLDDGEAELVAALRAGDEDAYEKVVRLYTPRLLATARRIVGNEEDARDAVQEGFLSAYKGLSGFGGQSRLSTWLHRIVVNAALMRLRGKQRKPERPISELLPRFYNDGHQAEPAGDWEPADALLQRKETRALVRESIDQLPESYREVLLLRDIEGLDTGEAARALGVNEGVVKTRLHRARQALRTLLDSHFRGGVA
jgi:RNA polymerase sigma-70 factor (ECF subfamily)